jgi:hypothetical protein
MSTNQVVITLCGLLLGGCVGTADLIRSGELKAVTEDSGSLHLQTPIVSRDDTGLIVRGQVRRLSSAGFFPAKVYVFEVASDHTIVRTVQGKLSLSSSHGRTRVATYEVKLPGPERADSLIRVALKNNQHETE